MNKKLSCVIIDDEDSAIKSLTNMIEEHPSLELFKTHNDPINALADILNAPVIDILFLDISMPKLNGLELVELITHKIRFLIFATAHAQYALEAFQLKAIQYLLKPINSIDFLKAINQVNTLINNGKTIIISAEDDSLYINIGIKGQYARIEKEDIILFHADGNHINILTNKSSYYVHAGIKRVTEDLENDNRFMRVHKSYIIKLTAIKKLIGNSIVLEKGLEAQVSIQYKERFFEYINQKALKNRQ